MQACPNCGYQNPSNIPVCLSCATSLRLNCPNCGQQVVEGDKFCRECGTSLSEKAASQGELTRDSSSQKATEKLLMSLRASMPDSLARKIELFENKLLGQRRDITVLMVELVNLDLAIEKLGSELVFLITDELLRLLAKIIYKYEGIVDHFSGDSLMALFGLPINHENDPERAVRASLEMHDMIQPKLKRIRSEHDFYLDIRVGINTGLVIAGKMSGTQQLEYTVIGDTVNLASDLMKAADPGMTFVSFRSYQRTNPIFDFQPTSTINLNGYQTPVSVYQPIRVRLVPGEVRGLPGLRSPLIGREKDLQCLDQAYQAVQKTGRGGVVFISGNAGIGKTRLVGEFRNTASENAAHAYIGTCASYMRISPYRVVSELIRNIIQVVELDPEDVQREALHYHIDRLDLNQAEVFPYLLNVLGLMDIDSVADAQLRFLDPSMMQKQIHSALRAFLFAEAEQHESTILIFDDLHWVDPASLTFINFLVESIADYSILLVLIARDFILDTQITPLINTAKKYIDDIYNINLLPLTSDNARKLLDSLIKQDNEDIISIKEKIVSRSGGSPYYAEELLRILIDNDGLEYLEGNWEIKPRAEQIIGEVPGTLQDIFLARLDKLDESLQQLVQQSSVFQGAFAVELLYSISNEAPETILNGLHILEEREFLTRAFFGTREGYLFKHPLLQTTVYSTILKRDVQNLHLKVARAIESRTYLVPGESSELLAYHYSESSKPEEAIRHLITAAESAAANFSNETVIQHYRQALDLLQSAHTPNVDLVVKANIGLGKALKFTGEFSEAVDVLDDSVKILGDQNNVLSEDSNQYTSLLLDGLRELADIRTREGKLDLAVSLLQQAQNTLEAKGTEKYPEQWRQILDRLAWVNFRQGKLEEAFHLADLALIGSDQWEASDPITLSSLNNTIGGILYMRSRPRDAASHVERSLEIYTGLNYHWGMAIALTNLGVLKYELGRWQEAVENLEQADSIRVQYGYTPERAINLKDLGDILVNLGDFTNAREKLEKSLEISLQLGMSLSVVYASIGLCSLALVEENIDEAEEHLETAESYFGNGSNEPDDRSIQILLCKAQINAARNQLDQAIEYAERAMLVAPETGVIRIKIESLRLYGKLLAQVGEFEKAFEQFKTSMEVVENQSHQYDRARTLYEMGIAYLLWAEKDREKIVEFEGKASSYFEQAIELFDSLGAKNDRMLASQARNRLISKQSSNSRLVQEENQDAQVANVRSILGLAEGEWYQAAALYVDLAPQVGADEELIFESVLLISTPIINIVQEAGGEFIRHQNGLTAVFGAPSALENAPERAVETAIELMNFYQELHSQTQFPLVLRAGVAMGRIVAGFTEGTEGFNFVAAGETLQFARKLALAASPTKILVTLPVKNATDFRFSYSPYSDKSTDLSSLEALQLDGLRDQIGPVRGLIGIKIPFVGRQSEMELIHQMAQNLGINKGGVVFLEGEPGIGKSRLMREFSSSFGSDNIHSFFAACSPRRSTVAFSLVSDLISQSLDLQPNYSPEQIIDRIDSALNEWPDSLQNFGPYLELFAGVSPRGELGEQLLSLEPEQFRRQTFVAIRRWITTLAQDRPFIMMLDDIQWIDSVSADLLFFLTNLVSNNRLFIIATIRATEAEPIEATINRIKSFLGEQALEIPIRPLSQKNSHYLLQEFLANANLPDEVLDLIVRQSGGNPYYIEEFVRMMLEQDYLRTNRGRIERNQSFEIDRLSVPASLEMLIRARVDSLPPQTRRLLQVASIISQSFDVGLLENVAGQKDVFHILELLSARGMLTRLENERWEFTHPLIETIVYNTVLKANRQSLHLRTALALEEQWLGLENEHAEELAYHFIRGQDEVKARSYFVSAGERAAARYANDEALDFFMQAADLLEVNPAANDELVWRISCGLGEVYQFTGNYEASLDALKTGMSLESSSELSPAQIAGLFRRIGDTAFKQGDPAFAVENLLKAIEILNEPGDPPSAAEAARAYSRLGFSYFRQAKLDLAETAAIKARYFAEKSLAAPAMAVPENLLGNIYYRQGQVEMAMRHTRNSMNYWQDVGYNWGVAATLSNLGILEVLSGNWDAAIESFSRSLKMRQEMGDVEGVCINNNNLGTLARDQGNLELAESHLRDSLAVSRPFQMNWQTCNSLMGLAQVLLYQNKEVEAWDVLQEGINMVDRIHARDLLPEMRLTEAEILMAFGDYGKAETIARQAGELSRMTESHPLDALSWKVVSESLYHQGDFRSALGVLDRAWEALSKGSEELVTGRIHAQAMLIYKALHENEKADEHFRSGKEIFTRLGASRDLNLLEQAVKTS